ncbi:MAG TPA: hypothetical protein VKT72_02140 [Candidatus Baltobacteraceae bacterium]|nr:hypothetical protein [Candidatus Baltobacteraceae bacterium]
MRNVVFTVLIVVLGCGASAYGQVPANNPYPTMAPIAKYLMPRAAEIEAARSAGPASISAHAEVLVFTKRGYVVAAKGSNGWVCLVGRMWTAGFDDPEFWNPKGRGAGCLNPPAVKSVLPQYLARTKWALAGNTREEIAKKCQAAYADHQFTDPAPASFAFMLSKHSYLNDGVKGPWRPHVMPFVALDQVNTWAASFKGSPILSPATATFRRYEPVTIVIPVAFWSDGSPAPK